MNVRDAETNIKKYKSDMERRKRDAIEYIRTDNIVSAMLALNDVSQCQAVISEYEFIIDLMEVGE